MTLNKYYLWHKRYLCHCGESVPAQDWEGVCPTCGCEKEASLVIARFSREHNNSSVGFTEKLVIWDTCQFNQKDAK